VWSGRVKACRDSFVEVPAGRRGPLSPRRPHRAVAPERAGLLAHGRARV